VHKDKAGLAEWHLSQAVTALLNDHENGLIRDIVDRNYRNADAPHATLKSVDAQALTLSMAVDSQLHMMGLDLSKDEQYERYGRKPPKDDNDRIPGMPVPP